MIREIIFSNKKYIAVDVIRATKKIKGNNNTNRAFLFQYDGKSINNPTGISDPELWGSQTPSLTIGKQITVGGILYDQIVACDSRPEAVGFYVYDSDLVPYNWGVKALYQLYIKLSHMLSPLERWCQHVKRNHLQQRKMVQCCR